MPTKMPSQRRGAIRQRSATPPADSPHFEGIRELAAALTALHRQMAAECATGVQDMIRCRTRDQRKIEAMLDRLLECACIPEGLALFRSLCRYYYNINPAATVRYVNAYREMWDNDDTEEVES